MKLTGRPVYSGRPFLCRRKTIRNSNRGIAKKDLAAQVRACISSNPSRQKANLELAQLALSPGLYWPGVFLSVCGEEEADIA
jgi:hypothetical protein